LTRNSNKQYIFWSGNGTKKSSVTGPYKRLRKVFNATGIPKALDSPQYNAAQESTHKEGCMALAVYDLETRNEQNEFIEDLLGSVKDGNVPIYLAPSWIAARARTSTT
jgi:hypothetical protein